MERIWWLVCNGKLFSKIEYSELGLSHYVNKDQDKSRMKDQDKSRIQTLYRNVI